MAFCSNCGGKVNDGDDFCISCGAKIAVGNNDSGNQKTEIAGYNSNMGTPAVAKKNMGNSIENREQEKNDKASECGKGEDAFVDSEEKLAFRLGKNWNVNLVALGRMKTVSAMVTDKRVYLQGRLYESEGSMLIRHQTDKIVDIEDVNATGLRYKSRIGFMIAAIISSILTVLVIFLGSWMSYLIINGLSCAVLFWLLFILDKRTICHIEYAGGSVEFFVIMPGIPQIQMFFKEIHRAKDSLRNECRKDH